MLVLHKNYAFSHKDIGKSVVLADAQIVQIMTVIKEAGELHSIYGKTENGELIVWDPSGVAESKSKNISIILEK